MSVLVLVGLCLLGAFGHRRLLARFGSGSLAHLVRLPGNLLHELAHALALLATGYTVADFTVSLADPAGRGGVRSGPAWHGFARPWIANLLAPVAPVFAGGIALWFLHGWADVPGLPASAGAVPVLVRGIEWERWQLWAGLALAFSVTAEIAPSDVDLAGWWRPALVAGALVAAALYAVQLTAPGAVQAHYAALDAALWPPVAKALAMAVWSGLAVAPVAWLVGKVRGA